MSDLLSLASALLAGLLLGAFFFGGLWWTVARGLTSASPALWFVGSLMLRMTATMAGLYFVGREDWRRWLLCLLGFVIARQSVKSLPRAKIRYDDARGEEGGHAP